MEKKRLRVIAGPNGSGKSTFIKTFPISSKITLGYYVNADDIEDTLKNEFCLSIDEFGMSFDSEKIQEHFKNSTFAPVKLSTKDIWKNFTVRNNILYVDKSLEMNSYIAADLADFLRNSLRENGMSFSFETVMSDKRKIDFLKSSKDAGYRIYLYFFATEDPEINKNRVSNRVTLHGHRVDPDVIEKRYYRSLENLREAVLISNRAYLFDSSAMPSVLVAEVTDGMKVKVIEPNQTPNWFIKYLMDSK